MSDLIFDLPYSFVLIGNLKANHKNSFISVPFNQSLKVKIEKAEQNFLVLEPKNKIEINFNKTQTLPSVYKDLKKIFENYFHKIHQVEQIPGLKITLEKKLGKDDLAILVITIIKSLNKFHSLNLDNDKIFNIILKINLQKSDNFLPQSLVAIFQKPIFYNIETKSYLILTLKQFNFLIFDLEKTLNSQIFKSYEKQKKYQEEVVEIYQRLSFLASQGQKAISQIALTQLGEILTKNQKAINNLGFSCPQAHKLFVNSFLAGSYGSKVFVFKNNLYFLTLINKSDENNIINEFKSQKINLSNLQIS